MKPVDPNKRFDVKWRFDSVTGCYNWIASVERKGYGKFKVAGRFLPAHRWAWERKNGPIPPGMLACHRCDNPRCVNPDHIFLGTHQDNVDDMIKKGRMVRKVGEVGDLNPNAKLDAASVVDMRQLNRTQGFGARRLAKRFNISRTQAKRIITGVSWTSI